MEVDEVDALTCHFFSDWGEKGFYTIQQFKHSRRLSTEFCKSNFRSLRLVSTRMFAK
jgi:hypothetical protein